MKQTKQICIFLAFFILFSNMGFAFNIRYCGNDITSVTLKTPAQDQSLEKDCCGVVEKKSHCCKDKEVKFQKKTDDLIQKIVSFHLGFIFLTNEWNPSVFSFVSNFKKDSSTSYYCDANAPPFFNLYHQYIFYA
ncbi:HYC_CC_PP family protein [Flavobacterium sp. ZT3P35]|uniref:HYC_CC_PP family protein n=1 Tax=Flavobacterium sp. ZT3P35 TaxID=3401727 RepID=UPI003AAAD722